MTQNANQQAEKLNCSFMAGEFVKWNSQYGKQFDSFLKK
jgi:hypothetical protein